MWKNRLIKALVGYSSVWMCVAADWEESLLEAMVYRPLLNQAAFDLQPSVVTAVAAVVQNYKQIPQWKKITCWSFARIECFQKGQPNH